MKQLSLKSINDKAPLEVSLTTSGTFTFGTSYGTGIEFMYGHNGAIENDGPAVELTDWSGINTLKVEANKVYWNEELKHKSPEASFRTSATDLSQTSVECEL